MTRYCVQISRWYALEADDETAAEEQALERDLMHRTKPVISVTDLDAAGRPIEVQPGMCPYPMRGRLMARECVEAGTCGCDQQGTHQL